MLRWIGSRKTVHLRVVVTKAWEWNRLQVTKAWKWDCLQGTKAWEWDCLQGTKAWEWDCLQVTKAWEWDCLQGTKAWEWDCLQGTKAWEWDCTVHQHTYLLEVWKGKLLQRNVQDLVIVIQNSTLNLLQVVELQQSNLRVEKRNYRLLSKHLVSMALHHIEGQVLSSWYWHVSVLTWSKATLWKTRQAFLTGLCIDSHTLTAIVGHSLTSTIWYNTVETNRMLRKVSIRHGSKLERKEREYMLHMTDLQLPFSSGLWNDLSPPARCEELWSQLHKGISNCGSVTDRSGIQHLGAT